MNYDAIWSVLLVFLIGHCANGIRLNLSPNTQKCLKDNVQAHQLTVIKFEVSDAPGQRVDYVIKDSRNGILAKKEGMSRQAKASFTTEFADTYELCVSSHVSQGIQGQVQQLQLSIVTTKGTTQPPKKRTNIT